KDIDSQLVGGAALFGIGWGIAGFCPGGAIPALGLGRAETLIFVLAMVAGIAVGRLARTRLARLATT
ncbi:YeeE/YedE family protein, partial [Mesorhizobium sp. M2A.F.Ca.ET.029.05.1.1]